MTPNEKPGLFWRAFDAAIDSRNVGTAAILALGGLIITGDCIERASVCPTAIATTNGVVTTAAAPDEDGTCTVDIFSADPLGEIKAYKISPQAAHAILNGADDFRSRVERAIEVDPGDGSVRIVVTDGGVEKRAVVKRTVDNPHQEDSPTNCRRAFTESKIHPGRVGHREVTAATDRDDGCDGDLNASTMAIWGEGNSSMVGGLGPHLEFLMLGRADIDQNGRGRLGYRNGYARPYTASGMTDWMMRPAGDAAQQ